jgi:hypothetical protein
MVNCLSVRVEDRVEKNEAAILCPVAKPSLDENQHENQRKN